jgi:membrane-bound serine protease (ClpP class)
MKALRKRICFIFLSFFLPIGFLFFLTCDIFPYEEKPIYDISISGYTINPATEDYIVKSIQKANLKGSAIIISLDTPGGLLDSTRNIVKEITNSKVPVVVYVSPKGARAGSAGVFITLSAHVAVMAPSTNIGAAHPVQMRQRRSGIEELLRVIADRLRRKDDGDGKREKGKDPEQAEVLSQKIMSDTLAWISTIAENRKRNVEWAKKAVLESASITEKEALNVGIIDFIAQDKPELLEKLHNRKIRINEKTVTLNTADAPLSVVDMTFRQGFLNIIANPTIAYILVMLGFYGLMFEFTNPGIGFPGIAGTISIILGFYALHTLPINFAGIALIVLGIILFIAETQVTSFGLLTLGGLACMFLGSVMLIDSPYQFMRVSINVILPFVLATGGITIFLTGIAIRTYRKKLKCGKEGMVGEKSQALSDFKFKEGLYHGKCFVHGEIWNARSKDKMLKGDSATVIKVDGIMLMVSKI